MHCLADPDQELEDASLPPGGRECAMTVTTVRAAGVGQKAAARTEDAVKVYGTGQVQVRALDAVTVEFTRGPLHRDHGPVRLGEIDAAAVRGGP
jgi:hypothetical protein